MAGRRRSDRALRDKLRSPGRPGMARREDRLRFWALIAAGLSSEDAAIGAGCRRRSGPVGFGRLVACPLRHLRHRRSRCRGAILAFAEREEIALGACTGLWSARDRPADSSSSHDPCSAR